MTRRAMVEARVLVLIPSFNHGAFIEARVRSVLNQRFGAALDGNKISLDVRLIDDGSSDNTMRVLDGIKDPRFAARQRQVNSGSPFTAWIEACEILQAGRHDFIWIAESDDRAAPDFLTHGLAAMACEPEAVLYYTHSWYVDERDLIIGHSINYLKKNFPEIEWGRPTTVDGKDFIAGTLLRGMAIPNMSSALIRAGAFRDAVEPTYGKFRLAADWIFAIALSRYGKILFDPRDANYFRHHQRTARGEANHARVVAEHMSATRAAYLTGLCKKEAYVAQMQVWAGAYRHERVARSDLIDLICKVNPEALDELLAFIPN